MTVMWRVTSRARRQFVVMAFFFLGEGTSPLVRRRLGGSLDDTAVSCRGLGGAGVAGSFTLK